MSMDVRLEQLVMPRFNFTGRAGGTGFEVKRTDHGDDQTGQLKMAQGKVRTKNALLKLRESKLFFSRAFREPFF